MACGDHLYPDRSGAPSSLRPRRDSDCVGVQRAGWRKCPLTHGKAGYGRGTGLVAGCGFACRVAPEPLQRCVPAVLRQHGQRWKIRKKADSGIPAAGECAGDCGMAGRVGRACVAWRGVRPWLSVPPTGPRLRILGLVAGQRNQDSRDCAPAAHAGRWGNHWLGNDSDKLISLSPPESQPSAESCITARSSTASPT